MIREKWKFVNNMMNEVVQIDEERKRNLVTNDDEHFMYFEFCILYEAQK